MNGINEAITPLILANNTCAAGLGNLIGSSLDGQLINGQGLAMILAGIGIRLGMILGLM